MIQIDMQMPERCGVCFAMHTDEIGLESWCGIDETARDIYTEEINTKRPEWCPLKEQEAKTGKWIEQTDYMGDTYYDCSVCNESWITIEGTPWVNGMNYCPHCGAKMEFEGR